MEPAENFPSTSLVFCVCLAILHTTSDTPLIFLLNARGKCNRRGRRLWWKERVPQQQQLLAASLAFPAQRGEETGGHVELSNVLTCPSPHLLPPH